MLDDTLREVCPSCDNDLPRREKFSSFDLFRWLSDSARVAFEQASFRRHYAPGQLIYSQSEPGQHMFRVISGCVRLSVMHRDGRELLYLLFGPGDCFGESSVVDGEPRPHTAEAQGDLEVAVLNRDALNRIRARHPIFDDALLRLLARHMRLMSAFFSDASLNDISSRVASRIVAAARSFGTSTDAGIHLSVRLPQSEIAAMVGVSRQLVNRVCRQFQDEGLLSVKHGALQIHDIERLRQRGAYGLTIPPMSPS